MVTLYISNAYLPSNNINFWAEKIGVSIAFQDLFIFYNIGNAHFYWKISYSHRKIRKFCIFFFSPDIDLTYGSHFFSDTEENYIQTKKIFHPLVVLSILSVSAQEIIRNSFLFKLLYQLDSLWNINRNQDMERVNGHRNHPRNRLRDQPMCFFPFIEYYKPFSQYCVKTQDLLFFIIDFTYLWICQMKNILNVN